MTDYQAWLDAITYKPGWTLSIASPPPHDAFFTAAILEVQHVTESTYPPHEPVPIISRHSIRREMRRDEFNQLVRHLITRQEMHELDEHLRVDGTLMRDPHGGEMRMTVRNVSPEFIERLTS